METVIVIVIIAVVLLLGVRIVSQSNAYVIERLGKYHATWNAGIHFLIPIVDRIARSVSLKE